LSEADAHEWLTCEKEGKTKDRCLTQSATQTVNPWALLMDEKWAVD
jgi:hypothetical protein